MKKLVLASLVLAGSLFAIEGKNMTMYKSPYCGCCDDWANIMKEKGFNIKTIKTDEVNKIKAQVGLQPGQTSCHTAIVDGYVVEGHVNYSAIKKMLTEKPDIIGISTPGMPIGSPGMEQGNQKDPYNIIAIHKDGSETIYEKHNQ